MTNPFKKLEHINLMENFGPNERVIPEQDSIAESSRQAVEEQNLMVRN